MMDSLLARSARERGGRRAHKSHLVISTPSALQKVIEEKGKVVLDTARILIRLSEDYSASQELCNCCWGLPHFLLFPLLPAALP